MKSTLTLRERAEATVRDHRAGVERLSVDEIRGRLHKLRVHEIELEMQNEELRRTQIDLADSRDRYNHLYGASLSIQPARSRGVAVICTLPLRKPGQSEREP